MKGEPVVLDELDVVLKNLRTKIKGVRGSVLADTNGLPLASDLVGDFDVAVVAAMGAMIAQSADTVFGNLRISAPEIVVIEGSEANLAVLGLPGGVASFLVLLDKNANVGLVKLAMKQTAGVMADALGATPVARPHISELFILSGTGLLVRHYSDFLRTDIDRDILAGMLSAVQSFVRETLAAKDGVLEEMKYGKHAICFVRGNHTVAAFVVPSDATEAARYAVFDALHDFEERYAEVLPSWNGSTDAFPGIDECFTKVLRA